MKIAIEQIRPWIRMSKESAGIPLYNTQADLQLLSKLRSQSYRGYLSELAKLPETDISTKIDSTDLDIERHDAALIVSALLPTQREVYLDATVPRIKIDELSNYFDGEIELGAPIVTFNSRFVIDGHHRWLSVALLNPRGKIRVVDFTSETMTPIQFLKLLQGAIVMEEGELPKTPEGKYEIDVFHASAKRIKDYIEEAVDVEVLRYLKKHFELDTSERALSYLQQNALSIKYNNLPAVGSPSRELMPQTDDSMQSLDTVMDAPVLADTEQE